VEVHVTAVFAVVPFTVAVNAMGSPRKAALSPGVTSTTTGVTTIDAFALFVGSWTLLAVTVYVPPATGAVNVAELPAGAIVPPEDVHVTAVFVAFVSVAVSV
jgi:hypothetical protein